MKDWKFHCAILKISEHASLKDVRKAYRKLALERHPDKHNGSQESHEAFQQLNESYRHIAAALIAGHQGPDIPPPPPNYANQTRQASPSLKREHPAQQFPKPVKNFTRVWIHAGIACAVLFVISIAIERAAVREPAYDKSYKPDLFPKAWCFVHSYENEKEFKEVAELWSQRVCEEKCSSLSTQKDVSCEWSGDKFRVAKSTAAAPRTAAAPIDPITASCEISIESLNGRSMNTPYRNQTESTCRLVCTEMMKEKSRDGVRCVWNGTEFNRQALYRPVVESQAKPAKTESRVEPINPNPEYNVSPLAADSFGQKGPCFMSVVNSTGPFAEAIPGHTLKSCEKICIAQIYRDPSGSEVKCAFGGKQFITYFPDPLASYLEREPAGENNFVQGSEFMATCQIHGRIGGVKNLGRAEVSSGAGCKSLCASENHKAPKGTEVVCSFDGENFFRKVKE